MKDKTRVLILLRKEEVIMKKVKLLNMLQKSFNIISGLLKSKSESLQEDVEDYKKTRRKFQKEIWKERCAGWCQKCNKEFFLSQTQLLYTQSIEEDEKYIRRIVRVCKDCAQIIYNQERLGENLFECFDVKKKNDIFYIFKNDNWQEIPRVEKVIIQIEGNNILEKDFEIGKYLEFYDYPRLIFRINGKDFFAKPVCVKTTTGKEEK